MAAIRPARKASRRSSVPPELDDGHVASGEAELLQRHGGGDIGLRTERADADGLSSERCGRFAARAEEAEAHRVRAGRDEAIVATLGVGVDGGREADGHRLKTSLPHLREPAAAAFSVHDVDIEPAHPEEPCVARHPEREHVHGRRGDADAERLLRACRTGSETEERA